MQVTNNGYQNGAYDRSLERAVDPTDVPQRLTISAVYELPFGAGKQFDPHNRFVNAFIGGWQAQTIITLQKGLPVLDHRRVQQPGHAAELHGAIGESFESHAVRMVQYGGLCQSAELHLRQCGPRSAGCAQSGFLQLRSLADQE